MAAAKRTIKVELSIQETGEGMYPSTTTVATESFDIPLPANGKAVSAALTRHLSALNRTVIEFRGRVAQEQTVTEDEPSVDELVLD